MTMQWTRLHKLDRDTMMTARPLNYLNYKWERILKITHAHTQKKNNFVHLTLTTTDSSLELSRLTRRGIRPVWTTTSMRSFAPSVRYETAQHASASTSRSSQCSRRMRVGRITLIVSKGGDGFLLRQRFDRVHVTFLR